MVVLCTYLPTLGVTVSACCRTPWVGCFGGIWKLNLDLDLDLELDLDLGWLLTHPFSMM